MSLPTYVVVTPAHNEAQFIELTLKAVISQEVLPLKWVIVSDGSSDGTDDIVMRYVEKNPWIELVRLPERKERHFAGKVNAFNHGYAKLEGLQYDAIASLDADVSFGPDYFSFLLGKLAADPSLGLIGTPFRDPSIKTYDYRFVSIEHVSGACQVFRRECFTAIGGYTPSKAGGVDHIAVITARMRGWKTRTFTETFCEHHRAMGTAQAGKLKANFKVGALDYALGGHPAWEIFRTLYQMTKKPFIIGGLTIGFGYLSAAIRGQERPVSPELVAFRRREQLARLKNLLRVGVGQGA